MSNLIPKAAIELAIKGGWNDELQHLEWWFDERGVMQCDNGNGIAAQYGSDPLTQEKLALSKDFWVCLGKELGWPIAYNEFDPNIVFAQVWADNAHRFLHLVLKEQPTDAYWDDLLPDTQKSL